MNFLNVKRQNCLVEPEVEIEMGVWGGGSRAEQGRVGEDSFNGKHFLRQ